MKHAKTVVIFEKTELTEKERSLLHLIPLVQTAWAHGAVASREKHLIFRAAREDGIDGRDSFNDLLDNILTYQPSAELFEDCLSKIGEDFSRITNKERRILREKILKRCREVAASAGSNSPMDLDYHTSEEEMLYLQRLDEILQ